MSELQILFPKPEVIRLQGRRVKIRAVQLHQFEQFGATAGLLVALLADATDARIYAFAKNTSALNAVLAATTDLNWWRRRLLPASVAIELLVRVVRINSGFFGQALLALASELAGLKARKP